ncbi:type II CRISPR RNA-guided endonuclease Cas9 [Flavobacterium gawalongense]|uniref:type II CRISPR RNA-guided endonuclease Cas9 n=1 Tax=Flavobacterium gawalongense TaxID=2594432 RepID=UPI001183AC2B|nr:type II CRISPR RNA-guided endonuclease Cas9 [Flavobacterium gawalongense]TRX11340.1 type II CRISPR RNA-guided endonuclease Cas9 [Flavobacterium gawalongense]TRX28975.1 type II CRISPR RNA-guided endonuclease Cas9 [Flavobacterium gawalongense]
MTKILGLDLGTNSIGWAIVDKDSNDFSLVDKGVRIFSEGVKSEKGIESSRAAERTAFRSARKLKYRRKLRKYETLKVLSINGMCPLSIKEVEEWKKSGFKQYPLNPEFLKWLRTDEEENINPYVFRDRASKQKVSLFEFGRALYHIAQRRGFLSNRLDQSAEGILEEHCPQITLLIEDSISNTEILIELKDYFFNVGILDETNKGGFKKELDEGEAKLRTLYNALLGIVKRNENKFIIAKEEIIARLNRKEDLGKVKGKIKDISQAMIDGDFKTLGQYFFSLYNKSKIRNQYTSREEHYLEEFNIICKIQGIGEIIADELLPEKKYNGLAKDLYKAIFFQRPLKSQKGLIGKCSFEKSKTRCAISHPDFEEYRMWTYLNTIKIGTQSEKTLRFLSLEEKQSLIPKFLRKKDNFNFEDLAKELIPKGETFNFYKSSKANEVNYLFNYKPYDTVAASPVSASLKNIFGDDWKTKIISYKSKNAKGIEVNRTVDYKDLWHLLSVSTSDIYLFQYAKQKLGLDDKNAKAFSKIRLKKDFASLSLNAITKILPYVKEGLLYSHGVFMANIESIVDESIWNDGNQRKFIQDKIAEIIENHTYENGQLEVINSLIKECKTVGAFYSKEAESIYKSDLNKKLIPFFKFHKIELDKESFLNELFPILIEQLIKYEYVKISRLDEKVLDFIKGKNDDGEIFCTNEKRINKLYHPSDIEVFKKKIIKDEFGNEKVVLGSPRTSSIKNPMAMRALHQLRKVLNTLIFDGQVDEKTIIHIEMARELNDANKRKGIQDYQNENKKNREEFAKDIRKLYFEECKKEIEPTEDDLLRYQLWLEQNKQEIYEDGRNISICDIIGTDPKYDFEHTVPRSRSQDNSQMNKTLCSQKFNRNIKGNKMPFELSNHKEILLRVAHWKEESDNFTREIEIISRSIKAAATKELKDKKIRRRHYLTLKRDYLKGKFDRFIWEEPKVGFKNSQIPDTGIITKYSQAYLKSYFKRVESVKGGMVAEFRKIWGIQESFQENDKKYFHEKDRSKHTHHTIDAITIACMTKEKYDALANAWTQEDKGQLAEARKLLADSKPWKTFKEDLKKIEEEILVSHYTPDNVKKQSKKIVRIRGKKQYVSETIKDVNGKVIVQKDANEKIIFKLDKDGKRISRLQQGDTIRGSLHQDSIYGAIKNPLNTEEIRYVIRKDLESIKASDVENIVDEMVKEKVKEAISNKVLLISSNAQQKNKLAENQKVWMNEEKGIPINKVRLYANSVKNPLEIKEHSALSKSRHEHKQKVYGQNDENYCMAIYELYGKRDFELINNFNLAKLIKQGQGNYPLNKEKQLKGKKVQIPIAKSNNRDVVLKRGQQVIFYDKEIEKPKDITEIIDFKGRIYIIEGLSIQRIPSVSGSVNEYGVITLRYFKEARKSDEIKKDNFKPDGIYKLGEIKPTRKMNHSQFSAFVEGIDFKVLPSGKFQKI